MAKTINYNLRFGYFRNVLNTKKSVITKKISNLEKSRNEEDKALLAMYCQFLSDISDVNEITWELIESIANGDVSSVRTIDGKLIEVDKNTFVYKKDRVFFQMVHDRDDALYKKRVDEKRESIQLDDDEYLSEFCSIIYHKPTNCFMMQRNRYSISVRQFARFLGQCLIEKYQSELSEKQKQQEKNFPVAFDLSPVLDGERLKAIKNNKAVEKITISGSVTALQNLSAKKENINFPIFDIRSSLQDMKGETFTLTITANKERIDKRIEYDSLNQNAVEDLFDAYQEIEEDQENIKVAMQYQNQENMRDVLVWSTPLKESYIQINKGPREHIPYIVLQKEMDHELKKELENLKRLV